MGQQHSSNGCEALDRGIFDESGARMDGPSRTKWGTMLDVLVGAPLRLHHYRHLHAEVIEDALRAYDGGTDCGGRA